MYIATYFITLPQMVAKVYIHKLGTDIYICRNDHAAKFSSKIVTNSTFMYMCNHCISKYVATG